jgi:hypothetical protein
VRWSEHIGHRWENRCAYRFWWGNLNDKGHLEDPGANGRIILKFIFKKWGGDMDWIDLAKNRVRSRALVSALIKLRVP